MRKNNVTFLNGISSLLSDVRLPKIPRILSIGVGTTTDTEIGALNKIFNKNYFYTGIDVSPGNIKKYNIQRDSTIRMICADASDIQQLNNAGIKEKSFDLVILRHPNFASYRETFLRIITNTIPRLLKKNGLFVLSLLDDSEEIFFNTIETRILYESKGRVINETTRAVNHNTNTKSAFYIDKIMRLFKNNFDYNPEKRSEFKMVCKEHEKQIIKTIVRLGGKHCRSNSSNIVKINPDFIDPLKRILGNTISFAPIAKQGNQSINNSLFSTNISNLKKALNAITPWKSGWRCSRKDKKLWMKTNQDKVGNQIVEHFNNEFICNFKGRKNLKAEKAKVKPKKENTEPAWVITIPLISAQDLNKISPMILQAQSLLEKSNK